MKKIFIIIVLLFITTGCTIVQIDTKSVDNITSVVLSKNNKLYNRIGKGYKYYKPRGVSYIDTNELNDILYSNGNYYYLYIDAISYYNKTNIEYKENKNLYYSKKISYDDKFGYLEIVKEDKKYHIEFMYNYAKIEAYVDKDNLNQSVMNMAYILSSIQYNRKVIETLIGENSLDYKEEKYDIFKSERENSTFVEYAEKYYNYDDKKDKDQDILDFDVIE